MRFNLHICKKTMKAKSNIQNVLYIPVSRRFSWILINNKNCWVYVENLHNFKSFQSTIT